MGSRTMPPRGSIPGRNPGGKISSETELSVLLGGLGSLLGGALKTLGKTVESVQNLNLEDLKKLAEAQGNQEAKEKIDELKKILGEKGIGNFLGEGLDLGKLIEFAAKHGGESSQEFAGGKGMIRGGLRGHVLGVPLGGKDLPLGRRGVGESTGSTFEVKGRRPEKTSTKKVEARQEPDIHEPEMDPIEEDENCLKVRGYMAGVDEQDITCEIKESGRILKISAQGRRKYEKEVVLSSPVTEKVDWSYKNGILEVVLQKKGE